MAVSHWCPAVPPSFTCILYLPTCSILSTWVHSHVPEVAFQSHLFKNCHKVHVTWFLLINPSHIDSFALLFSKGHILETLGAYLSSFLLRLDTDIPILPVCPLRASSVPFGIVAHFPLPKPPHKIITFSPELTPLFLSTPLIQVDSSLTHSHSSPTSAYLHEFKFCMVFPYASPYCCFPETLYFPITIQPYFCHLPVSPWTQKLLSHYLLSCWPMLTPATVIPNEQCWVHLRSKFIPNLCLYYSQ